MSLMVEFSEVQVNIMDYVSPKRHIEYLLIKVSYLASELATLEVKDWQLNLLAMEEGLCGPGERYHQVFLLLGKSDALQVKVLHLRLVKLIKGGKGFVGV
jgi:hypothetical protein